jgi:hypothetical protein
MDREATNAEDLTLNEAFVKRCLALIESSRRRRTGEVRLEKEVTATILKYRRTVCEP